MPNEQNIVAHQYKPGESGNPAGKPKGSKNLATLVRELESEDFDWSKVPLKQRDAVKSMGSPWKAIVFTALAKAVSGDVKAMEWLRKSGYGDKLDITTLGKEIQSPLIISRISPRNAQPEEQTADSN